MGIRKNAAAIAAGWAIVFVGAHCTLISAEAKQPLSKNLKQDFLNSELSNPQTLNPDFLNSESSNQPTPDLDFLNSEKLKPKVFFDPVDDSAVLGHLTKSRLTKLPTEIEILLWNVQKGEGGADFKKDFLYLSQDKTLIALQEFLENGFVDKTVKLVPDLEIWAARSFFTQDKSSPTGVATGAAATAVKSQFLRSEDTEPVADTAKMTLITDYEMQNGENLKVINTHGINFTTTGALRRQLEAVYNSVKDYPGKMIWLGDFNTWNPDRFDILMRVTSDLGLFKVKFNTDPRTFEFDHLFYRGCRLLSAFVLDQITSSDHYPIYATLDCQ